MTPSISDIDRMISDHQHKQARRVIRAALRRSPRNHRLLTALARSYSDPSWDYDRDWRVALVWHRKALAVAPTCPIVLQDYAETVGGQESIKALRRLVARSPHSLMREGCVRSLVRAREKITFAYYTLSLWHWKYRQWPKAIKAGKLSARRARASGDAVSARAAMTIVHWCQEAMMKARR